MSFPAYPKYKDSGVEWLGQIPDHWRVDRIKASVASARNGIWGEEADGEGSNIPCVRVADFDRGMLSVKLKDPTLRKVTEKERIGRVIKRGDLLLEKSGGGEGQPVGCVVLYEDDEPAVCSNFVAKVELSDGMDSSFWRYVHAAAYSIRLTTCSINQTSGIQNLDQAAYFNEKVGFPPADEQSVIAKFLDHETAKIDALIIEQERLIKFLAEKRLSVILGSVLRGINPSVSMKDSGVEWIGLIPSHWGVSKIKNVARLESGHTPSKQIPEYWENCTIPWVSLNDSKYLAANDYIHDTAFKISELGMANSSARLLEEGAVVFTRDATIGLAAITTRQMAVSQHLIAWCPGERLDALYLLRCINAMAPALEASTFGATIKTIGMADVKKLAIPLPPIEEQIAIAKQIEKKLSEIDELNFNVRQAIFYLQEHRYALIAAAVTGKIDVRGWNESTNQ